MIQVTQPFLPPEEEYNELVKDIWKRNWLTNNGPLLNELELKLKEKLGLEHLLITNNGTIALQIAIKALSLRGEIITTPFSYIATTSSIVWESCAPVFADIDKQTFNIDPISVENQITEKTSAILTTHVFGNVSEIDSLQEIANRHKLKVIYDASHCYGVTYRNKSVLEFGDVSTLSMHATKLFHTVEGGAIISNTPELIYRASKMRNFGHHGEGVFDGVGINGKNSELHAAMGLCNLKYVEQILGSRKKQYLYYKHRLSDKRLIFQKLKNEEGYNYSYFPLIFESESLLIQTKKALEENHVFTRRYFYPSLSRLDYIDRFSTPESDSVASRVLCLPLFHELSQTTQELICRIIIRTLRYS